MLQALGGQPPLADVAGDGQCGRPPVEQEEVRADFQRDDPPVAGDMVPLKQDMPPPLQLGQSLWQRIRLARGAERSRGHLQQLLATVAEHLAGDVIDFQEGPRGVVVAEAEDEDRVVTAVE